MQTYKKKGEVQSFAEQCSKGGTLNAEGHPNITLSSARLCDDGQGLTYL